MNTLDAYFERGIEKGRVEGIEEGIEKGREAEREVIVRNLITSKQFTTSQIANFAGVPESFVERVLANMKKN